MLPVAFKEAAHIILHEKLLLLTLKSSCFSIFCCSVSDAIVIFTAEVDNEVGVGYDFLYLGVEGGHLVVKFNNLGGLEASTLTGTSNVRVNDTELHQVQVLFRSGTVDLLVDNSDRITVAGL